MRKQIASPASKDLENIKVNKGKSRIKEDDGYNYTFQDYLCRHKFLDPFGTNYRNAYRNLLYSIDPKRNSEIYQKLMEGSINGYQLVRMSSREIASPQTKQKIKEVLENGLKKRALKEDTTNYTYNVYTCSECGGTTIKLTHIRRKLQADRFRTKGTCVVCKYSWDIS